MQLGQHIRELRRERSLTQEELSEVMGVSVAAVSKWETGQSVPELTALAALADFFAVSIDSLIGHVVQSHRMERLIEKMNSQSARGEPDAAMQTAEEILHYFPNEYNAVDACAELYYAVHIRTDDHDAMEKAIRLVEQLFLLTDDKSELKRQALLARLANMYELQGDWANAIEKYEKSNTCGVNDLRIAGCLHHQGKTEEALQKLSDILQKDSFHIFNQAMLLAEIWTELGDKGNAIAALNWGAAALVPLSGSKNDYFIAVMQMHIGLFCEEIDRREEAENAIRQAVSYTLRGERGMDAPVLPAADA